MPLLLLCVDFEGHKIPSVNPGSGARTLEHKGILGAHRGRSFHVSPHVSIFDHALRLGVRRFCGTFEGHEPVALRRRSSEMARVPEFFERGAAARAPRRKATVEARRQLIVGHRENRPEPVVKSIVSVSSLLTYVKS